MGYISHTESVDKIQPIFYKGSQMKELLAPEGGVFVGVSIIPSSPLLSTLGMYTFFTQLIIIQYD